MAWPAISAAEEEGAAWAFAPLRSARDLQWLVVTDLDEWEALPTTWASPLHVAATAAAAEPKLLALATGPARPLKVIAALE